MNTPPVLTCPSGSSLEGNMCVSEPIYSCTFQDEVLNKETNMCEKITIDPSSNNNESKYTTTMMMIPNIPSSTTRLPSSSYSKDKCPSSGYFYMKQENMCYPI